MPFCVTNQRSLLFELFFKLAKGRRGVLLRADAVELGTIKWRRFPDGYPNIFIENADDIRGRHVAFLASFHDAGDYFRTDFRRYSRLPKMFVASFTLILPFFPTGTFERVDKEGEVPTAVTLARMLSNIPSSRGGPTLDDYIRHSRCKNAFTLAMAYRLYSSPEFRYCSSNSQNCKMKTMEMKKSPSRTPTRAPVNVSTVSSRTSSPSCAPKFAKATSESSPSKKATR